MSILACTECGSEFEWERVPGTRGRNRRKCYVCSGDVCSDCGSPTVDKRVRCGDCAAVHAARVCAVNACGEKVHGNGFCKLHYQRDRMGYAMHGKSCAHCGAKIDYGRARFCSKDCKTDFYRAESGREPVERFDECQQCGAPISLPRRKFCSRNCGIYWQWENNGKPCSEPGCERPKRTRGLCQMHYKRLRRTEGMRLPSDAWSDRRKHHQHARRAVVSSGEIVTVEKLVARDGLACSWCGDDIDLSVNYPDRLSKSIDHVVPIARGGEHSLANTQLLHLTCNFQKSDRLESAPAVGA